MESNRGTSSELDAGSGGRGPARSAPRNIYTLYRPVCGGQSQCRVSVCVTGLFTERSFLSPPVQRSFRHVHVLASFALRPSEQASGPDGSPESCTERRGWELQIGRACSESPFGAYVALHRTSWYFTHALSADDT